MLTCLPTTTIAIQANIDHIKRVGVIGSGQMGVGIAYVAANVSRLPVVIMDINKEQTEKGLQFISNVSIYIPFIYLLMLDK